MAGTLAVSKKVYKKVSWYNHVSGYRLSADDAYLVIRGLRTLDLRLEKHQENTKSRKGATFPQPGKPGCVDQCKMVVLLVASS